MVDQADRGWAGVTGAVVAGSFDPVGVVAASLDHPGVGPVAAPGLRCFLRVMSAMTLARMRSRCSDTPWAELSSGCGALVRGVLRPGDCLVVGGAGFEAAVDPAG